jgi:rfaE bifunctional protein kinase chain/domain
VARNFEDLLASLPRLHVMVVGDLMLDRFEMGHVERISPEAPVPVVQVHTEEVRVGGAANVAANVAALGARVTVAGVVGPGPASEELEAALLARGIATTALVRCDERVTTVKTRILGGGQQIVRIDRETRAPLTSATRARLLAAIRSQEDADVFIVSDYGKGVIGSELMEHARSWRKAGRPVVVDPKQADFQLYRETTCITPNAREAGGAVHDEVRDDASAIRVGRALRERLGTDLVLLTRGEQGMSLIEAERVTHLPTEASRVYDVTGAGDTVIATFATMLGAGMPAVDAARWANRAAGIAVRRLGTVAVGAADLRDAERTEHGGERS